MVSGVIYVYTLGGDQEWSTAESADQSATSKRIGYSISRR
jgi:hypothetical protein